MPDFEPSLFSLPKAIEGIDEGSVRLPSFQRPFKWPTSKQKALFDSIQKRHPAGSLLLLESASGQTPFGSDAFAHTPDAARDGTARYLVLDGQQRLTSCYLGIYNRGPKTFFLDLPGLFTASGGLPANDADLDLDALLVVKNHEHMPEKRLFDDGLMPMAFLRSRDTMRSQLSSYKSNLRTANPDDELLRFLDTRFESYVDAFFEYSFPAVILPSSLDLDAVCKVFMVINTTGLKLSAFDLCVARFYPQGIDLKSKYKAASEQHAATIQALDEDGTNILQTIALLSKDEDGNRIPSKKAGLAKHLKPSHISAHWDEAVGGLVTAGEIIALASDSGSPDSSLVPYDAFVPSLAAVAATIKKTVPHGIEASLVKPKLLRWFYASAVAQRYNEGTDQKQSEDFEKIVQWCVGGETTAPDFIGAATWNLAALRVSAKGSAIGRALLAALNRHRPTDPVSGDLLGRGRLPASEVHHVFPRAYLRKQGVANAQINSVLNQTFLTPETNKWVSDDGPSAYLAKFVSEVMRRDDVSREVAENRVRGYLASHFISGPTFEAMKRNDFDSFVSARADEIRKYIEHEFGVTLTVVAGTDDPSLTDLEAESEDEAAA